MTKAKFETVEVQSITLEPIQNGVLGRLNYKLDGEYETAEWAHKTWADAILWLEEFVDDED